MSGSSSTSKNVADIINIIPPKLKRNYDVYIVLTPKENNNTEEQNLIDFDTDTSWSNISETSKSDVDFKRELSVIDLYEDISVNPQTLSLQQKSIDEVVFDPLELKSNNEAMANTSGNTDKYAALRDFPKTYNGTCSNVASNVEAVDGREYNLHAIECFNNKEEFIIPNLKLTNDTDEDLIDDLLSSHIQRLGVNHDKYVINNYNNKNVSEASSDMNQRKGFGESKVNKARLEIPKIIRTEPQVSSVPKDKINKTNDLSSVPEINKLKHATPLSIEINKRLQLGAIPKLNRVEPIFAPRTTLTSTNLSQFVLSKQIFEKPTPVEEIRQHIKHLLKSKTKYCNVLIYYNPKDFLYANENKFIVETVTLDKKKYNKKRISVEDSDAKKYTKGPNFDEKTRVLPQIIDRLVKKKERMEKYAHCKKKLILDCGSQRTTEIPVKFDPVILTEDCNKDRLKNLLARQSFVRFVRTGQLD